MIEEVYISGPLGKALFKEGGTRFILDAASPERPVECRPADLSSFFGYGAEYSASDEGPTDLGRVRAALEFRHRAHRALSLLLSGLDAELDNDTRSLAIEAAEGLLRHEPVRDFARARLLASPLPPEADVEGARLLAEYTNSPAAARAYEELAAAAAAISAVCDAWAAAAPENFPSREEQAAGESAMIEAGVFADLAAAAASRSLELLNSAVVKHSVGRELKARVPQISHILNALRSRLTEGDTFSTVKETTEAGDDSLVAQSRKEARTFNLRDAINRYRSRRDERKSRKLRAPVAKEKVDKQIAAIEKQIRRGTLNRAERYLQDLINFQIAHSEAHHLAMSLCSLAKTGIDSGAYGLAETMLDYAFSLGVEDAVTWTTKAELLKSQGSLNEALAAYDEAAALFPGDVFARSGRADVLKEMGRLDEALAAYEETAHLFPENDVARNGRAEVLKEMGRLDEALAAYNETITLFPRDAFARTGRAGVLKAMGRFDDALAAYVETSGMFPGDRVVRSGRASLLMLMNRVWEARSILSDARPMTRDDWIDYHILAMSYLREGEINEAVRRLDYGLENTPWGAQRAYFATALGVAKMREKRFDEAIRVFETDVLSLDVFQRQKRMVLIGHSHAEKGRREVAARALSLAGQPTDPHLRRLKDDVMRRFTLDPLFDAAPSEAEIAVLDERIAEEEFFLAVAA